MFSTFACGLLTKHGAAEWDAEVVHLALRPLVFRDDETFGALVNRIGFHRSLNESVSCSASNCRRQLFGLQNKTIENAPLGRGLIIMDTTQDVPHKVS